LQSFEGGLVVVSHDRHLIKTVADTLWLVADGRLQVFEGDLDDYQQWLKTRARAEQAALDKPKPARRARDSLTRLRRELDQIERRLANVTAERAAVEAAMAEVHLARAQTYARSKTARPAAADELADKSARLSRDAAALEARWLEVGTAIEAEEAQASDGG